MMEELILQLVVATLRQTTKSVNACPAATNLPISREMQSRKSHCFPLSRTERTSESLAKGQICKPELLIGRATVLPESASKNVCTLQALTKRFRTASSENVQKTPYLCVQSGVVLSIMTCFIPAARDRVAFVVVFRPIGVFPISVVLDSATLHLDGSQNNNFIILGYFPRTSRKIKGDSSCVLIVAC